VVIVTRLSGGLCPMVQIYSHPAGNCGLIGEDCPFIVTYWWSYTFIPNYVSLSSVVWKMGFGRSFWIKDGDILTVSYIVVSYL